MFASDFPSENPRYQNRTFHKQTRSTQFAKSTLFDASFRVFRFLRLIKLKFNKLIFINLRGIYHSNGFSKRAENVEFKDLSKFIFLHRKLSFTKSFSLKTEPLNVAERLL